MMVKKIMLLLVGMFVLVSCEKEIYEGGTPSMTIEQYSPVMENGVMTLRGKISIPNEFNRKTVKAGFYVSKFSSYMNDYIDNLLDDYQVVDAYKSLLYEEDNGEWYNDSKFFWIDRINADGTYVMPFVPQLEQYVCIAFVINALDVNNDNLQVLQSDPFFFKGEATAQLELTEPLLHRFELTFIADFDCEIGLCWSASNQLPNMEDNCIHRGSYANEYGEQILSSSMSFERLNFGDNEVVYLRGYVQKRIDDSSNSNILGYRTIYSNVIEFRPKDLIVEINSKEDFVKSMFFCSDPVNEDYRNYYIGDDIFKTFRGKIHFNYEVQKEDWLDISRTEEYGDSIYWDIPKVNCTITGKGFIPNVSTISKSGIIKGMSLGRCYTNYGLLENVQTSEIDENRGSIKGGVYISIGSNYGQLIDSKNVYVNYNMGLVKDCKDVYGGIETDEYGNVYRGRSRMVETNGSEGNIINCTIENNNVENNYLICETNCGYMENCLPNPFCCANNYGIIKNPYVEDEYE